MTLWVDADACPGTIKELIIRAAKRLKIPAVFVANKYISIPESSYVWSRRIGADPEAVDMHIAQNAQPGDVVVTQDIPLASTLVANGIIVIAPEGNSSRRKISGSGFQSATSCRTSARQGALRPAPKNSLRKTGSVLRIRWTECSPGS